MTKIHCHLIAHSCSHHLQQVYTGFHLLQAQGLITLDQEIHTESYIVPDRPHHLRDARHAQLAVVVNDSLRLQFDTHDSWEIDEEYLDAADFYFKRSYAPERLAYLGAERDKVYPLGFYYWLNPDQPDWLSVMRYLKLGNKNQKIIGTLRALAKLDLIVNQWHYTPRLSHMSHPPTYAEPARVLFMARTWDPTENPEFDDEKAEERHAINEMRAGCVRALRDAFGDRFYGGLSHTSYAVQNYPDCLLPDPSSSERHQYTNRVKAFAIGVATAGLHQSIGGKMGEYVAFSRGIVSETLAYQVPGGFSQAANYLAFTTPDECARQIQRLFDDQALLRTMMENNARYYQQFLRPDRLVLRTLEIALSGLAVDATANTMAIV